MPEPESYITINDPKCPRHESRLRGSRGAENGGTKADEEEGEKVACASVKPKSKGKTKAEGDERGKMKEPRGKRQYPSSQPQPPSQPAPASEPAPEPEADTSSLFFIDLTPTAIPTVLIDTTPAVALDTSVAPDP
ncbi:hypothetical protein BJ165DRAFT_1482932, partial [Panaeolus papilionaceus]